MKGKDSNNTAEPTDAQKKDSNSVIERWADGTIIVLNKT